MSEPVSGPWAFRPRGSTVLRGLRARVLATLGVIFAGAISLVLYAGFLATHFAWYQNVAVFLAVLIAGVGLVVAMWVSWGMRMFRQGWERVDDPSDLPTQFL
ncbi:MAG: hypothetical protein L3K19_02805 [Thermoplasmata archaeon]|nr:hypothetical protein [Thermoplasmata archaeon]